MMNVNRLAAAVAAFVACASAWAGLKDEMRQPWQRDTPAYIRGWKQAGVFRCDLARECLDIPGGEAAANPATAQKRADGKAVEWRDHYAWGDTVEFGAAQGERDGAVAFAFATVERAAAGKATLAIGSSDGIRVWLNGKAVLTRDAHRSLTPDEDSLELEFAKGANTLLIKAAATSSFTARVLEVGTVLARVTEIGPSLIELQPEMFTVRTDVDKTRASAEPVTVEVIRAGGEVAFSATAKRGELVVVDAKGWPDGAYEVRARTLTPTGLRYVSYLAWFKGDSLALARALAADAAKADAAEPAGFTLRMLAELVDDRLGVKLAAATSQTLGNPWPKIHSPLMEYQEILLERAGQKDARVRAGGFVRLAWRDDVDGSPQYARAYLPPGYDPAKKWPLALHLHGYNPANPVYVRWWSVDSRHTDDREFAGHEQVIFIEPHGRNNTQYLGLGDTDVMRVLAEARRLFNVDENRVYLSGESMGGWGTWNVASRHPDVFAAIAPIFGGVDYHSQMTEEQLAALTPADRYLQERGSSWAMAEGLNNLPIYILHGAEDNTVNVEWTHWGLKLLQRWGYDVRYHEYPGRTHETLPTSDSNSKVVIPVLLQHRRDPDPRHVRLRSAELRHAKSYWVNVLQFATPFEFADVDAEVVDRNVIRLDTRNVLDVTLSPSAVLVDPARPLKVVWNGVARESRLTDGVLRLTDAAYKPGKLVKNAALPGGIFDFTTTPFAVVIGTSSKDPQMAKALRDKANAFVAVWSDWQKQPPRVFDDVKLSDADIAKYSLLLFGGADANRVTAKLAAGLPLRMANDRITLDGKVFTAPNSLTHLLYPNPRNPQRYVWLIAASSPDAWLGNDVTPFDLPIWDYAIFDGRVPAYGQVATRTQTALASGMFDRNWRFDRTLLVDGSAVERAKAHQIVRPKPAGSVSSVELDRYVGKYRLPNGLIARIERDGTRLFAITDERQELRAQTETGFYLPTYGMWIEFVSDAAGKVTSFTGAGRGDFEAPRVD